MNAYLFASDDHAPRRRRPNDVLTLITSIVLFALFWWAAGLGSLSADATVSRLVLHPPGWIQSIAWVAYTASGLYLVVVVVATFQRAGTTRGVIRDVACALALSVAAALVVAATTVGELPDIFPELVTHPSNPTFPAFRLALVTAVLGVLGPHLALSVRRIGRWAIIGCAAATLLLGLAPMSGVIEAVLLAFAVIAVIRLVFGTPEGLPPIGRLTASLATLGVITADLAYDAEQPTQVGRATATTADGRSLTVEVYGRDAADAQRAARLWNRMWYRSSGPSPAIGQLRQAQHEGLGLLLADQAGVDAGTLVAIGADEIGDAVVVVEPPRGETFATTSEEEITDDCLRSIWRSLLTLHEHRLAHGAIGPASIILDGSDAGWVDFAAFSVGAGPPRLAADVAALLVTIAATVGADRALDAALATWPHEDLEAAVPYLQKRALPSDTRRWADEHDVDTDALRDALIGALKIEPPRTVELRRVTWTSLLMLVFGAIAANVIVSQIAKIGWNVLADELAAASIGWLVASFCIRLGGYVNGWMSLRIVLGDHVPLGPTTLLQSAKSFVGLVVPATMARVAMDVRFLVKVGTPTPIALAQGPLISFVGFLSEVVLLLITVGTVTADIQSDKLSLPSVGGLVVVAVVVVVVALIIVLATPSLRNRVLPPVREAIGSIREVVFSPVRLLKLFGSEGLDNIVSALSLVAVGMAFGVHLSLAEAIFVTVGTGLLAGLAPIPGGIGVAEAMLTALLTAIGLPSEEAFAIAISYRLTTTYLPPVLGFFSLRWLRNNSYL